MTRARRGRGAWPRRCAAATPVAAAGRAAHAAAVRAEPPAARGAPARGLRHGDARRPRRAGRGGGGRGRLRRSSTCRADREADLVAAVHAARGAGDGDRRQRRGAQPLRLVAPRRPGRPSTGPSSSSTSRTPTPGSPGAARRCSRRVADGTVAGFGGLGYELAVEAAARLARARPRTSAGRGARSRPMPHGLRPQPSPAWTSPGACRASRRASASRLRRACSSRSSTNIRYLTGFTGSAGLLLVARDGSLLVTDGRYRDQAAEQLEAAGVEPERSRSAGSAASSRRSPAAPGLRGSASRPTTSPGSLELRLAGRPRALAELVATTGARRAAPGGEGRGRARPDRAGVRHRRRRARPGEGAAWPRASTEPSSPPSSSRDAPPRRDGSVVRDDRGERAERRACPTPGRPSADRRRASSSSSTSARRSTATAPT